MAFGFLISQQTTTNCKMNYQLRERIIEILFEEVGKIKVHIIDPNSSILEIEYEEIADKILQEMSDWLGPF
jgi:hypothetical protein